MAPSKPETPIIGWTLNDGVQIHLILLADKVVLSGWGPEGKGFDGLEFHFEDHGDREMAQAVSLKLTESLEKHGCALEIVPHAVTLSQPPSTVSVSLSDIPVLRRKIISTLFLDGERLTPYA